MSEKILNLTHHLTSKEQAALGLFDPSEEDKQKIINLLFFNEKPTHEEIVRRVRELYKIVKKYNVKTVMLGSASYMNVILHDYLREKGYKIVYAYMKRVPAKEKILITKDYTIRFEGWIVPDGGE